jgi:hypothetical protein
MTAIHPAQPITLVAIDIDGTLLNSQHAITARNLSAIQAAQSAGVTVIIATGRPRRTAEKYIAYLNLGTPGVYMQGLALYDGGGNLLEERLTSREASRCVIQFAVDHDLPVLVYNSTRIVTRRRDESTDALLRFGENVPEIAADFFALPDQMPINKFVFPLRPETIPATRAALQEALGERGTVITSHDYLMEALPPGASKGDGLLRLLRHLNVDPAQVMAIGDAENDVEMLEYVGFGVAMANATDHLKSVADHVTASNDEDGVAVAIERFVLNGG